MKYFFVLFLFCAIEKVISAKGQSYPDSIRMELGKSVSTLRSVELLCAEALYYRHQDTAQSFRLLKKGRIMAAGNPDALINVYCGYIGLYRKMKDRPRRSAYLDSALHYKDGNILTLSKAMIFYASGMNQSDLDNNAEGISELSKALLLFEQNGKYEKVAETCHELAGIYGTVNDLPNQEKYARKAYNAGLKASTPDAMLTGRIVMAIYYKNLLKNGNEAYFDSAVNMYSLLIRDARTQANKISNKHLIPIACLNLSDLYSPKLPNNKDLFLTALTDAESFARQWNMKVVLYNALGLRGNYLLAQKEPDAAEALFTQGLQQLQKQDSLNNYNAAQFCRSLMDVAEMQNDFAKYRHFNDLYLKYNQKLLDKEKLDAMQRAEVKFETIQKQQRIEDLEEQNKWAKKLNIITGVAVIGLIAGLIFSWRSHYFRKRLHSEQAALMLEKQEAAELRANLQERETLQALIEKELTEQQKEKLHQQLMSSLVQLGQKNELLKEIKEQMPANTGKLIKESLRDDQNYDDFRKNIEATHPAFFSRLMEKSHNTLTPLDLKYCAYIYMGISNKDIARNLSVEPKSVHMTRYRIRQKLSLLEGQDLDHFIKGIIA